MKVRFLRYFNIIEMNAQPNIYLIGLGAIGAGYSAMAKDSQNYDMKIIVNQDRKKRYSENGFMINGKKYDFQYLTEPVEKVDLLLIAVKATQLEEALEQARPFVSEDTIILSLLNGVSSERIISEKLGKGKVLPAFTVKSDGQRKGNIIDFSLEGRVVFGPSCEDDTAFAEKAEQMLSVAGIPFENDKNIALRQWWKMTANVGGNQIQALLDVNYGAFKNENVAAIARAAMLETIAVANQKGIPLPQKTTEEVLALYASFKPENITSMMQDMKAKRKTEVDIFAGEVCRLGKELGVETPVNRMLLHAIKWKESQF